MELEGKRAPANSPSALEMSLLYLGLADADLAFCAERANDRAVVGQYSKWSRIRHHSD